MQCTVCGKTVKPVTRYVFVLARNKTYARIKIHKTCSRKCRHYAQGSFTRMPPGKCKVAGCKYFGKLDKGVCGKHYQYFWRHGRYTIPNPVIKPIQLTKCQAMWLAGVIDCEGWIGMFAQYRKNRSSAFWGSVGVGNTNPKLLKRIKAWTKVGRINVSDRGKRNKPLHMWTVARHEHVKALLLAVKPYLLLKREQADLVLSAPPKHTKANALRLRIKEKLTILNRKGIH